MNKYLDLVKPRYVIKTKYGYIEYSEYDSDIKKTEYGYTNSIIYAKDFCYKSSLLIIDKLLKRGIKAEILMIEGV